MSTFRLPIRITGPDSTCYPTMIADQITEVAAPSVGNIPAWLMVDGGSDNGVYVVFSIPKNFVGTPKLVVKAVLDGSPGASDVLGFTFRKRAVADNEAADGTFDAEQTSSATIGSGGSGHADEDLVEQSITLTAGDYSVDDQVYGYLALDVSSTTYAGNVLLTALEFEYADA